MIMDEDNHDATAQAVQHLRTALDADDAEEKEFHIREALQLLRFDDE